jgi:hypothetical protein
MTCQHTMTLGVYLLGALDPAERFAFESHLSFCDVCRGELVRLAPLPGMLNQITQEDFADDLPPTGTEGVPVTRTPPHTWADTEPVPLLPVMSDTPEVPRQRPRRRYWQVAAAAAVIALLTIGGIFGWQAIREPATPVAQGVTWSVTAPDGSASAAARLVDHEWGTEIVSKVEGLPPGRECYLVVYDHYGNREVAGWWGTDHDSNAEIPGSTSIPRSKIARLEFKLEDKTVALTIPAPPR